MPQLDRLFLFGLLQRTVLALAAGAEATFTEIEPCDGFADIVTGCGDTTSSIMTSLVLGTIPGPAWPWLVLVNAVLVVGYAGLVIFSVLRLVRGQEDA